MPIIACSEQNNGSTIRHDAFTRETSERHCQVGAKQFWNWHVWERLQAFMLPHFKLNTHPVIKVSVWKKDSLILMWYVKICSNLFVSVRSRGWSLYRSFSFGEVYFIMTVYLPNTSRSWHVSDGMYNCSPYGRDLTSMDERENKWCLERYLHTQRHTLGIVCGAAALMLE